MKSEKSDFILEVCDIYEPVLYTRPCTGELKNICKYGNDGCLG